MRSLLAAVFLLVALPAFAQQPPVADGFIPLSELADREVLPATPLVFYAYGFVWIAILGYLWSLWRRTTRLQAELDELRQRVNKGAR